jgi:hypothetical protein
MNTAGRLGLYAAGVAVAFAGAYGISAAVVPSGLAADLTKGSTMQDHHQGMAHSASTSEALPGLSLSAGGYILSSVHAPAAVGESSELSFQILDGNGEPLRDFERSHDKDLHLIVVRSDGANFRHVHPVLDKETGTWSLPWEWNEAGTYRVYADFAPAVEGGPDKLTLSRTVDVAGDFVPATATETRTTAQVAGFDLSVEGDLVAGTASDLTVSVSRDGEPVTGLEPYLGAFGHLVALREGDLAYLHVHAEGEEPQPGETSGPEIHFAAAAPTAGRYLLYLDFQVDGEVHTAEFVLDAGHGTGTHDDSGSHGDSGSHDDSGSSDSGPHGH